MNETAVKIAREHLPEIVKLAVEQVYINKVPSYSEVSREENAHRIAITLEEHLHYLETGDIDAWKAFCTRIINLRVSQGYPYTGVIEYNNTIHHTLETFLCEKLDALGTVDGKPAERAIQRVKERLRGIDTVTRLTLAAIAMSLQREKPKTGN